MTEIVYDKEWTLNTMLGAWPLTAIKLSISLVSEL